MSGTLKIHIDVPAHLDQQFDVADTDVVWALQQELARNPRAFDGHVRIWREPEAVVEEQANDQP